MDAKTCDVTIVLWDGMVRGAGCGPVGTTALVIIVLAVIGALIYLRRPMSRKD